MSAESNDPPVRVMRYRFSIGRTILTLAFGLAMVSLARSVILDMRGTSNVAAPLVERIESIFAVICILFLAALCLFACGWQFVRRPKLLFYEEHLEAVRVLLSSSFLTLPYSAIVGVNRRRLRRYLLGRGEALIHVEYPGGTLIIPECLLPRKREDTIYLMDWFGQKCWPGVVRDLVDEKDNSKESDSLTRKGKPQFRPLNGSQDVQQVLSTLVPGVARTERPKVSPIDSILNEYPLPAPLRWEAVEGNDSVFRVLAGSSEPTHYLKLYSANHYPPDVVLAEAEVVNRLATLGVRVAAPVRNRKAKWVTTAVHDLYTLAAVYERAPGRTIPGDQLSLAQCTALGRLAGETQRAMDGLAERYPFRVSDLTEMLDRPVERISRELAASHRKRLADVAASVQSVLEGLSRERVIFGLCHGDLYAGNAAFAGDQPTLFDFQSLEYTWRANDISQFLWRLGRSWDDADRGYRVARWEAFAAGYSELRVPTEPEVLAIPAFVPARAIWYMAFRLGRGQVLDQAYFDSRIAFLEAWMRSFDLL